MVRVALLRLGMGLLPGQSGLVDVRRPRLAVEFEKQVRHAFAVVVLPAGELDHQRLAGIDVDGDLLLLVQAVEEHRRRQHRDVAVMALVRREVSEHFRVHQVGSEIAVVHLATCGFLGIEAGGIEVDRGQVRADASHHG